MSLSIYMCPDKLFQGGSKEEHYPIYVLNKLSELYDVPIENLITENIKEKGKKILTILHYSVL